MCLTIQAHSLSALDNLWSLYQDGTLKARLETFFATDQLRELADGEQVETFVTIEEQEYKRARIELIGITQAGKLCLKLTGQNMLIIFKVIIS